MKSILDRNFAYTPSAATDLKKTFARIRRERRAAEAANAHAVAEALLKVSPMRHLPKAAAK
jgi:hypothetical protein